MYISNSNIGMATLLQQKQNCMKTLNNGGSVLVAATNQVGGSSSSVAATASTLTNGGLMLPQTQTILLTNGATGASNIISYQQYQQLLQQQQQQHTTTTTRLLMPHEMVSLPIGSIVSTGGGGLAVITSSSSGTAATANYNNISTSTATATQGAFLVAATTAAAATAANTNASTTMSSFQQQFQQQIAANNQQQTFQQQQQNIITTTADLNSFLHQQPQSQSTTATTATATRVVGTAMSNKQQQQTPPSKTASSTTATTTRYFSQFSQQQSCTSSNNSSNTTTTASTPAANVGNSTINRPTHVLINRSNKTIIAANTNAPQPQKLKHATIITSTSKPPTTKPAAASATTTKTTTTTTFNNKNISNNQNHNHLRVQQDKEQQVSNINSKPTTPATQQNTALNRYGVSTLQQLKPTAETCAQQQQQQQELQQQKSSASSNGISTSTASVPNGSSSKADASGASDVVAAADTTAVAANPNEDQEAQPEVDIVINNVVCSFSVRCHLNLREIALNGFNVEFRRENGMVTMKLRRPYTTASIWSSGRITCTGATSEDQAKIAARRYARCLQKLGFRVHFNNFRVVNVLGTCSMPWAIKIVNFSERYKKEASYEPELHPGVTYKLRFPKATLKIFSTGSITVTAASVANVQAAIEHIFPLVYEFRKNRTPEEKEQLRLKQLLQQGGTIEVIEVNETAKDDVKQHSPPPQKPTMTTVSDGAGAVKSCRMTAAAQTVGKRKRLQNDDDFDSDKVDDPMMLNDDSLDDSVILCDTDDLIEGPDEDDDDL